MSCEMIDTIAADLTSKAWICKKKDNGFKEYLIWINDPAIEFAKINLVFIITHPIYSS